MRLVFGIGDALDDFGRAPLSGPARRDPLPRTGGQNRVVLDLRSMLAIGATDCVRSTLSDFRNRMATRRRYALANKGHDTRALQAYLGHRNIQHTVRYTELSPTRFKDFWRD
jgi:integrase